MIMAPCGLHEYPKPLEPLDETSEDEKVKSLIRFWTYIESLQAVAATPALGHLYLPNVLSAKDRQAIEEYRTELKNILQRVSMIERDLTVYLARGIHNYKKEVTHTS